MIDQSTYFKVLEFLYEEAEILDNERYEEWLNLLSEDFEYLIPLPVVTKGKKLIYSENSYFIRGDKQKLALMIKRLRAPTGWALQSSASKLRRIVGNVRVSELDGKRIKARSSFVLCRTEGDEGKQYLITGGKEDILSHDPEIKLTRRIVYLDSPNVLTYNLYFPV